jgi:hypothetical protein
MPTLVRTWNLFHGNAPAAGGGIAATGLLREMVAAITAPDPDTGELPAIVCLQEVPPAALRHLAAWSGMQCHGAIASPPSIGPFAIPIGLGERITQLNPAVLRSAFRGQANAVLVRDGIAVLGATDGQLNGTELRDPSAALLGLDPLARLAWAKERRALQTLRLRLPDGRALRLVHAHATSFPSDPAIPDAEVAHLGRLLAAAADPGEIAVLAGDLNVPPHASPALQALRDSGFSEPAPWIDQILVRGAKLAPPGHPVTWPDERRTHAGLLLSDHAPVEVTIA